MVSGDVPADDEPGFPPREPAASDDSHPALNYGEGQLMIVLFRDEDHRLLLRVCFEFLRCSLKLELLMSYLTVCLPGRPDYLCLLTICLSVRVPTVAQCVRHLSSTTARPDPPAFLRPGLTGGRSIRH